MIKGNEVCKHGSQRRKCKICELEELIDNLRGDIAMALGNLEMVDEKSCSIDTWNYVSTAMSHIESVFEDMA